MRTSQQICFSGDYEFDSIKDDHFKISSTPYGSYLLSKLLNDEWCFQGYADSIFMKTNDIGTQTISLKVFRYCNSALCYHPHNQDYAIEFVIAPSFEDNPMTYMAYKMGKMDLGIEQNHYRQ